MRRMIFLAILALFIIPINNHACMMVFYRQDPMIYEITQRSIIIYDSENQKVGLIPQISFKGRPQDFCVVIPTPSVPKLNTVASTIFYEIENLTLPIYRGRDSGCFFGERGSVDYATSSESGGVNVLGEKSVGAFDTVTLSASDSGALIKWLQDNDYKFTAQDKSIIDFYIQKGWVFTAMKLNETSQTDSYGYYMYNINPIILRFTANSLVYPIRLMAINSEDSTDLVVYVLSDNKMSFPNANVEYANNIDDNELKEIEKDYPAFAGLIGQNRYITKLKRTFSIMEMDADIEITQSADNKEFKGVTYYSVSTLKDMIPLGMVILMLLGVRYIITRRKLEIERR
jgi:hypothetical protein